MPTRKSLTRKLRGARDAVKQDLEPRFEKLEAENRQLRAELDALRAQPEVEPEVKPLAEPAKPTARASHIVQPSGGGLPPAPDLRGEYERRVAGLRPGDVSGLMEVKREFRKRGLVVY